MATFGDISFGLTIPAGQSVRRNAGGTAYEAYTPGSATLTDRSVRVTQSAGQSITANTLTAVAFDTETFDTDTMHDNVTNNTRITFTNTGKYVITGAFTTDANAGVYCGVRLNGTTYIYKVGVGNVASSTANGCSIAFVYSFTAGDYIELMGTFGTTQNTKSGVDGCMLSALYFT